MTDDTDVCVLCLEEMTDDNKKSTLPECGHSYHTNCLLNALRFSRKCAQCRGYASGADSDSDSDSDNFSENSTIFQIQKM